jgi:6,7-dimethyl-8-ribityllumazine synthase
MPRVIEGQLTPPKGRFALCVSRFNGFITEQLLHGATDILLRHGVADEDLDVYRVPGTFELPALVRRVVEGGRYAGVVALGCVIRGGTPHFEYVAGEVSKGLGQIALNAPCAVSFGVLTCDTVEQAIDRAGVKAGNKGADAALACLEMVNLYARMAEAGKKR